MRYLETYKIFELNRNELRSLLSDETSWIKESLLNLSDADCLISIKPFNVRVDWKNSEDVPGLIINIKSDRLGKMIPIEVGDNLLTIDSYLKEEGWQGYNTYEYDNIYSPSRYQVNIKASLRGIDNKYERELSEFVKMLDRFTMNAPFDEIEVKYFKPPTSKDWVVNESNDVSKELIQDLLRDITDEDIPINIELYTPDPNKDIEWVLNYEQRILILIGDEDNINSNLPPQQTIDSLTSLNDYLIEEGYKFKSVAIWISDGSDIDNSLIKPITIVDFDDLISKIDSIYRIQKDDRFTNHQKIILMDIYYSNINI